MNHISPSRSGDRFELTGTAQRLVDAASQLFYYRGIKRTSVAEIAERAGILKGSMYYHFTSRQVILDAYLTQMIDRRLAWLEEACAGAETPRDQLLEIVDRAAAWMSQERFRGCPFLNAVVELPDDPMVAQRSHTARMVTLSFLRERFADAGAHDPEEAAGALFEVLYGTLAVIQLGAPLATVRGHADARATVLDRCARVRRSHRFAAAA